MTAFENTFSDLHGHRWWGSPVQKCGFAPFGVWLPRFRLSMLGPGTQGLVAPPTRYAMPSYSQATSCYAWCAHGRRAHHHCHAARLTSNKGVSRGELHSPFSRSPYDLLALPASYICTLPSGMGPCRHGPQACIVCDDVVVPGLVTHVWPTGYPRWAGGGAVA